MVLETHMTDRDGETEITVDGTVDLYSAPKLRTSILEAVPGANDRILVHLGGVSYMDSSGVAVLVEGLRSARKNDKAFVLRQPSRSVMKVLELAKLDAVFEITEQ